MTAFSYEITERVAILGESARGTTLELNRVSYNGAPPKWDIRRWGFGPDGGRRMLKGVTLDDGEAAALLDALSGRIAHVGGDAR